MTTHTEEPNKFLVPIAIIVAGALIAGAIYAGGSKAPATGTQQAAAVKTIPAPSSKDHIQGSLNAELVIVEYSDTECPWCKKFHDTMNVVMNTYEGRVAWVYRHLPFHKLASKESEALECAAELGGNAAFWKYLDEIFAITPSNDGLNPDELPKIAQAIGLDLPSFNVCLSSGRYAEAIKNGLDSAVKAGVTGTPYSTIFKNGKNVGTINGAQPLADIKAKIDPLLK